ncbi:MAG: MFS transporter [Gammaproteobacteria bacterium]
MTTYKYELGHKPKPVGTILPWFICSLAALFYCYEFFLRVAPSVMVPSLMHAYHIHAAQIGVLSAFYYYAYTPMQLPVGVLMDRYGPRRLLTMAILVCAIGSYLFVLTADVWVAEVGRAMVGFGSAFAFVGVLKLATVWLPENRFALISGLATMLGMVGAISGDTILTEFVHHFGWQVSMHLAAFVGVALAVLVWLIVRDVVPGTNIKTSAYQVRDTKHALKAFLFVVKDWRIWLSGIVGGLLFMPTSAFAALWGVPYLQVAFHFSPEEAGGGISMIFLGWAIGGPIAGWISDHMNRRRLPLTIGSIIAAILGALVFYLPSLSVFQVYGLLFLFGVFSSVEIIVFALSCEYASKKAAGTAIAFTNFLVMLGGVIFQPLIGFVIDWHASGAMEDGQPVYTVQDYQVALLVIPVCLLLAFVISFFLRETYCQHAHKPMQ